MLDEDGSRPKRSCTQSKKYYVLEDLFHDEDALMESSGSAIDKLVLHSIDINKRIIFC